MYFGGKFGNDGVSIIKGFVGYIMEIRLYSNSAQTIAELDAHIDWDCTLSTKKLCDFCPGQVTGGLVNVCLEDLTGPGRTSGYLKAQYNFDTASVSGYGRQYYRSTLNAKSYDFYIGTAFPQARNLDTDPHRTEANGLYFDGNDYATQNIQLDAFSSTSDILTFNTQFSVDLWVRFSELEISRNYYLFQKIRTYGNDTVMFQIYFTTNNSLVVELNQTRAVEIVNAYNG